MVRLWIVSLFLICEVMGCAGSGPVSSGDNAGAVSNPAAQSATSPQPSQEDQEWNAATADPIDLAKVNAFLQKYPSGSHSIVAQQIVGDEQLINGIVENGPHSQFVLPKDSVPAFISSGVSANPDRGRVSIDGDAHTAQNIFGNTILGQISAQGITNPSQIGMNYRPLLPCGDRSVFVISGTVENIQGVPADPLRLVYLRRYGVVIIGGKGKVFSMRGGTIGNVIFQTP